MSHLLSAERPPAGRDSDYKLLAGWQAQRRAFAPADGLRKLPERAGRPSWITKLREADEMAGTVPWTAMMWVKIEDAVPEYAAVPQELVIEPDEGLAPGEPGAVEVDGGLKQEIEVSAEAKEQEDEFPLYCMKYAVLGFPLDRPKLRVFCFHNAGSTESNYTAANTPFTTWAKDAGSVEIVALDYPGRNKLKDVKPHKSTTTLVPDLLAAVYSKLGDGVPYIVWAHSVGTWVSFELLILARKIGLPMPLAGFFNAFPAPHMPERHRPWSKTARMTDKRMQQEVMNWDEGHFTGAGQVVFDEPEWKETWAPLMKADFKLFDQYKFEHAGAPKFDFPIHAWHCEGENYTKPQMVRMWADWTSSKFDFDVLRKMGHLTCFYKAEYKKEYFERITAQLKIYYDDCL